MTDGWEELTINPEELQVGDIVTYLVKDYLRPSAPLINQGDWEILEAERISGTHIAVDDEGWAYDLAAVSFNCRMVGAEGRDEWKIFPCNRKVPIRRRRSDMQTCGACNGQGVVNDTGCQKCNGTGQQGSLQ